jgi:type IV pilus assembly protein PilM
MSILFSNTPFGLDISDHVIRYVLLDHSFGRQSLASYNEIALAGGWIVEGTIVKPTEVANALRSLLRPLSVRSASHQAIVSLPEKKSFIKLLTIPVDPDRTLEEQVTDLFSTHLPMSLETVYWDWQVVELPHAESTEQYVLCAACPKTIVDQTMSVLQSVGIIPVVMEIESIAISRAMMNLPIDRSSTLILDIGRDRATFMMVDDGMIQFTYGTSDLSGSIMTQLLAKAWNKSIEQAEQEKITLSLTNPRVWAACEPMIQYLADQIQKTMQYYGEHFAHFHPPSRVILSGGVAAFKDLNTTLSNALKLPVIVSNPFLHLTKGSLKRFRGQPLSYATAVGCALRGTKYL